MLGGLLLTALISWDKVSYELRSGLAASNA